MSAIKQRERVVGVVGGPTESAVWSHSCWWDELADSIGGFADVREMLALERDWTRRWTAHLTGLEQHLRLFNARPGMLTGGTMPEYLFRRTSGVVGLLERLIEEGCAEALDTGAERLTDNLLDTILINLGNDPTRDPAAGEVPPVPAVATRHRGRKPRNTVFDDKGSPAATARS